MNVIEVFTPLQAKFPCAKNKITDIKFRDILNKNTIVNIRHNITKRKCVACNNIQI